MGTGRASEEVSAQDALLIPTRELVRSSESNPLSDLRLLAAGVLAHALVDFLVITQFLLYVVPMDCSTLLGLTVFKKLIQ